MNDSKRAVAVKGNLNPQVAGWLQEQDEATVISLGEPEDENVEFDLIISPDRLKNRSIPLARLEEKKFNRQQSWFKSGKPLREWSDGPFHMGNMIVMATWMCGMEDYDMITFLNVEAEELVESKYQRRSFRSVMKRLIEEFHIGVRYTAKNSQLFNELGAEQFHPVDLDNGDVKTVELPEVDDLFENKYLATNISGSDTLTISSRKTQEASVTLSGGGVSDKSFVVTPFVTEKVSNEPEGRLVLTDPTAKAAVARAVKLCENHHEIYILSGEVRWEIEGIKTDFGISHRLSPSVIATLAFAMGEDFDYIKTEGVIDQCSKEEAAIIRGLGKTENVSHD